MKLGQPGDEQRFAVCPGCGGKHMIAVALTALGYELTPHSIEGFRTDPRWSDPPQCGRSGTLVTREEFEATYAHMRELDARLIADRKKRDAYSDAERRIMERFQRSMDADREALMRELDAFDAPQKGGA